MSIQEEMAALVEEFKGSGQTQKSFCEQKGIGIPKFNYWSRKLDRERSGPGFLPIRTGEGRLSAETVEVVYPNGVKLRVPSADLSLLSGLIRLY